MVWTRSPVYFYQRNDIYYFSRAVPKDLQARFNKRRVEVSLKTKSVDKARSLSMTLSDRLEQIYHERDLGRHLTQDEANERYTAWDIGLDNQAIDDYYIRKQEQANTHKHSSD